MIRVPWSFQSDRQFLEALEGIWNGHILKADSNWNYRGSFIKKSFKNRSLNSFIKRLSRIMHHKSCWNVHNFYLRKALEFFFRNPVDVLDWVWLEQKIFIKWKTFKRWNRSRIWDDGRSWRKNFKTSQKPTLHIATLMRNCRI